MDRINRFYDSVKNYFKGKQSVSDYSYKVKQQDSEDKSPNKKNVNVKNLNLLKK